MKKKVLCVVLAVLLGVGLGGFGLWYYSPVTFWAEISHEDVGYIQIFSGRTGQKFTVMDESEIRYIVENVHSVTARRHGLSGQEDGFGYSVNLIGKDGLEIAEIIVNSPDAVIGDPFLLRVIEGELCYVYLTELEKLYLQAFEM